MKEWRVSVEEYRDYPALNFHELLSFRRDPKAWRAGALATEETDAMRFGTALHAKILGGAVATFAAPLNEKTGAPFGSTTKTYKDALAAFKARNPGAVVVDEKDAATLDRLYVELQFHSDAPRLLADGVSELPVRGALETSEGVVELKGLVDRYAPGRIVEVKTTASLDDGYGRDKFRFAIYERKYILQLAFYQLLLCECCGEPWARCWIVAFERSAPNRVAVYSISDDVIVKARAVVVEWIQEYQRAQKTGAFVSRFDGAREITTYDELKDLQ